MRKFFGALLIFTLILLIPPIVTAQSPQLISNEDVVVIPADETVNRDLFAASKRVEIFGNINGDIFVAGGTINIAGNIEGNAYIAGGEVNISGNINGNTYLSAGQSTISGTLENTLTVMTGNLQISEQATIAGPVSVAAGNANISGTINDNLNIASGNTTITGEINGDTVAATGDLRITPQTHIAGYLMLWSSPEISIDQNANIEGDIIHKTMQSDLDQKEWLAAITTFNLYWKIASLISLFIVGLILIKLFPIHLTKNVEELMTNPVKSFVIGFLIILLAPFIILALLVSLIGIPLALILIPHYFVLLYLGKLPIIFWLGGTLRKDKDYNNYLSLIFGTLVYFVLIFIPFFGMIINWIAVTFGIGALALSVQGVYKNARNKKIV